MNAFTQSTKRLTPLLVFFTATLLLLLNAGCSQPDLTNANSTPQHTVAAAVTVSAGTPQLTQQYEFTEQDSGKTVTYTATSRLTIILNTQKYPKRNLQVSCNPAGTLGAISNIPSEGPPLYAVRYEGIQPGICTIKNRTFLLTVKVIALSDAIEPAETKD